MNPGFFNYSLNEGRDARLSYSISLIVLDSGGPGGFCTNMFDARHVIGNVWVIDRRTGSWAYEGKAVVMEVPVRIGDEPPKILDAVAAIVCDREEDGCESVVDADKIIVGGLSNNGEEGCCGGSKG